MTSRIVHTPDDWTPAQAELFRRLYTFMSRNERAFVHPALSVIAPEHWETTCYNAAYAAAEFADGCGTFTIMSDDQTVFASEIGGVIQ